MNLTKMSMDPLTDINESKSAGYESDDDEYGDPLIDIDESKSAGYESEEDEYGDTLTDIDKNETANEESNEDGKVWDSMMIINKNKKTQINDPVGETFEECPTKPEDVIETKIPVEYKIRLKQ